MSVKARVEASVSVDASLKEEKEVRKKGGMLLFDLTGQAARILLTFIFAYRYVLEQGYRA